MSDKSQGQKSLTSENSEIRTACPTCGKEMEKGFLNTSGHGITRIFIQTENCELDEPEFLSTSILFCRECKHAFLILD